MPLPLFWLGAAAVSALAVKEFSDDRKKQQSLRKQNAQVKTLDRLARYESATAIYPSDLFKTEQKVTPVFGSIVCCGIGGVLDHTGIWVDEDTIIELDGRGLVKPLSSQRFTKERSGKHIFVGCDSHGNPLASEAAGHRAIAQIYQYRDYHVLDNNCHQFIWQCFIPEDKPLSTFKTLNARLAQKFNRQVYWDLCQLD